MSVYVLWFSPKSEMCQPINPYRHLTESLTLSFEDQVEANYRFAFASELLFDDFLFRMHF
jgi:hypothetical protein